MSKEAFVPLSEAKPRLFELVRELAERDVILMRHGRPAGIMLAYETWQGLMDRIEELEDRIALYEARDETPDAGGLGEAEGRSRPVALWPTTSSSPHARPAPS